MSDFYAGVLGAEVGAASLIGGGEGKFGVVGPIGPGTVLRSFRFYGSYGDTNAQNAGPIFGVNFVVFDGRIRPSLDAGGFQAGRRLFAGSHNATLGLEVVTFCVGTSGSNELVLPCEIPIGEAGAYAGCAAFNSHADDCFGFFAVEIRRRAEVKGGGNAIFA